MINKPQIQPELAAAILEVIDELASELDLHYEDSDIIATGPTIAKMETLVNMLVASGYPISEEFVHIKGRYQRNLN